MSAPQILERAAEASGWFVRIQLGGALLLVSSFILVHLVARRSVSGRISIRRAAVSAVLLLSAASVVTPWRWSVPLPSLEALAVSAFGTDADWETGDRQMNPLSGADRGGERAISYESMEGMGHSRFSGNGERSHTPYVGAVIATWGAAAAGIFLYYVIGLGVLSRHARRAKDITDRISIPTGFRGRRRVRVLLGGPYHVPICFGLLRRTILLPSGASDWPVERLRAAVLHELAHFAGRDDWSLLRTRLVCSLCWPNPLAWMLSRALNRESDARCDEQVVRWGVSATAYARALVELAVDGRQPAIGVAMHVATRSSLSWRVKRLLELPPSQARSKGVAVAVILLVLVGFAGASAGIGAQSESVRVDPSSSASVIETAKEVMAGPSSTSTIGRSGIVIVAAPDANAGNPVPVEIVAALSDEAVDTLMGLNAALWFSRRPLSGDRIDDLRTVATVEIRPGTCTAIEVPEPVGAHPRGRFLFANYGPNGQNRLRLDWLRDRILVRLQQRGLNASDELPIGLTCANPEPPGPTSAGNSYDLDDSLSLRRIEDPSSDPPRDAGSCQLGNTRDRSWTPTSLRDAVATLLEDPDAQRRELAARAIPRLMREGPTAEDSSRGGQRGTKDHRHALTAGASDPATDVRLAAICALGQVGDAYALEVLGWRTASREDAEVQRAAAWATAQIRSRIGMQP